MTLSAVLLSKCSAFSCSMPLSSASCACEGVGTLDAAAAADAATALCCVRHRCISAISITNATRHRSRDSPDTSKSRSKLARSAEEGMDTGEDDEEEEEEEEAAVETGAAGDAGVRGGVTVGAAECAAVKSLLMPPPACLLELDDNAEAAAAAALVFLPLLAVAASGAPAKLLLLLSSRGRIRLMRPKSMLTER